MTSTRTTVILALAAAGLILGVGVAARVSPGFKSAATDVGLTALSCSSWSGCWALIAPVLDLWTHDDALPRSDNRDQLSDRRDVPVPGGSAPHTGNLR